MLFSVRQEVKDLSTMSEGREVGSSRTVSVQNGGGAECKRLWPGICTSIVIGQQEVQGLNPWDLEGKTKQQKLHL